MEPSKSMSVSFESVWTNKIWENYVNVTVQLVRGYRASVEIWIHLVSCYALERASNSKASLVLCNLPCAAITRRTYAGHEAIVNSNRECGYFQNGITKSTVWDHSTRRSRQQLGEKKISHSVSNRKFEERWKNVVSFTVTENLTNR